MTLRVDQENTVHKLCTYTRSMVILLTGIQQVIYCITAPPTANLVASMTG